MKIYIELSIGNKNHFTAVTLSSLMNIFPIKAKQGKKDKPDSMGFYNTKLTRLDYANLIKSNQFEHVHNLRELF